MIARLSNWIGSRIGFRPNLDPNQTQIHRLLRKAAQLWFEFIKRLAILAALAAGGKSSRVVEALYFISLFMLMIPIMSWADQFQLDRKTKNPTIHVPHIDGPPEVNINESQKEGWEYNLWWTLIGSIGALVIINVGIQSFVMKVSSYMAGIK